MSECPCLCERLAGPGKTHPRCLGEVWLFEGVRPEHWEAIGPELVHRSGQPGQELFRQGDPADSLFLLKMGSVKLWKATEDGRVLTLDIRNAGDVLGLDALISGGEYPVSATCLEPTVTCGIDRVTFENLVKGHPAVGLAVMRNMARRLDQLSQKLDALSEPLLEERLYKVLVNVAHQTGTRVPGGWSIAFPLSHEEIGFLVGAHRVSVTRALAKLRDAGKILVKNKHLFVTDFA